VFGAQEVNSYLEEPDYIQKLLKAQTLPAAKRATLENIHSVLDKAKNVTFESCVEEAR